MKVVNLKTKGTHSKTIKKSQVQSPFKEEIVKTSSTWSIILMKKNDYQKKKEFSIKVQDLKSFQDKEQICINFRMS